MKKPEKLTNILNNYLHNQTPNALASWFKLKNAWPKIVGANISKKTSPIKIVRKTLYLTVATSSWMEELKYLKEEIIIKINDELRNTEVQDIVFRMGNITNDDVSPDFHKPPNSNVLAGGPHLTQLSQKDINYIDRLVAHIKDDNLKESMRRAIIASKSRNIYC